MDVCELERQDTDQWDQYVRGSEHATVFHLASWKEVMQEAFGLRCHFLLAREDGQLRGVLPLVHVRNVFSEHYLTSMPGALCAEDEEAAAALFVHAQELVKHHGARYLVLRDARQKWPFPDLVTSEAHCTLVVRLHTDSDRNWSEINRRVRRYVKSAAGADLEVVVRQDLLDMYYPVYSKAMQENGTPTLGRGFFQKLIEHLAPLFAVVMVKQKQRVLGGGFIALFKGTLYSTWGGMLREFYDLNPNYLLYWKLLEYGIDQGCQWADLGRSAWDSGTYRFKRHWNAEPQPLYQQFYLNGRGRIPPVGGERKDDLGFRLFAALWRRLPLTVTELLGPQLRRQLPFG